MNTRFHVPTRVFGGRRSGRDRSASGPENPSVSPALVAGGDPVLIDPLLNDSPGKSCCYLIPGERKALIDPGSAQAAPRLLASLKDERIRIDLILLTHIHPDAAAGVGAIARRFPRARILAPAGAAGLLADPTAFLADTEEVYGSGAETFFGRPTAIEPGRIEPVEGDERIDLGDRTIATIATPGHTAAHLSYFDRATHSLFCGDALGVQLPGSRAVRPSTPPRDFSLEDSLDSIGKLAEIGAESVFLAHYGAARPGPEEIFPQAADALQRWHRSFLKQRSRSENDEDLARQFNACLEASLEPITPSARRDLETVSPAWLNLAGLSAEQTRLGNRFFDAA